MKILRAIGLIGGDKAPWSRYETEREIKIDKEIARGRPGIPRSDSKKPAGAVRQPTKKGENARTQNLFLRR